MTVCTEPIVPASGDEDAGRQVRSIDEMVMTGKTEILGKKLAPVSFVQANYTWTILEINWSTSKSKPYLHLSSLFILKRYLRGGTTYTS
jgi:hypothetical protein